MSDDDRHRELLTAALAAEADGQRALMAGDDRAGRARMAEAAGLYRESWQAAPPRSFGRLVGMLKAAVIAGDAAAQARFARDELGDASDSPASAYALGIAALVDGDDELAERAADGMADGDDAFGRAAAAVRALAHSNRADYAEAVRAIVDDFESRETHLTGVAIADTALMFERLAGQRGMAAGIASPLLPAG